MSKMGRLEVIFGPMFSGKTTEMIRRVNRHAISKRRCCIVKYIHDKRYTNDESRVCTHDNIELCNGTIRVMKTDVIEAIIYKIIFDFDVVGIDEGQFV